MFASPLSSAIFLYINNKALRDVNEGNADQRCEPTALDSTGVLRGSTSLGERTEAKAPPQACSISSRASRQAEKLSLPSFASS